MSKITDRPLRDQFPGFAMRLRIPFREVVADASVIAWSCDGQRLAVASLTGCDVWDIDTRAWEARRVFSINWDIWSRSCLARWSPIEPDILVLAHGDMMTRLCIDADGNGYVPTWETKFSPRLGIGSVMSFSPTGDQIA